jgi:hypothetical protein
MAELLRCISEKKGTRNTRCRKFREKAAWHRGRAHSGDWHRQISLLGKESVDKVRHLLPEIRPAPRGNI